MKEITLNPTEINARGDESIEMIYDRSYFFNQYIMSQTNKITKEKYKIMQRYLNFYEDLPVIFGNMFMIAVGIRPAWLIPNDLVVEVQRSIDNFMSIFPVDIYKDDGKNRVYLYNTNNLTLIEPPQNLGEILGYGSCSGDFDNDIPYSINVQISIKKYKKIYFNGKWAMGRVIKSSLPISLFSFICDVSDESKIAQGTYYARRLTEEFDKYNIEYLGCLTLEYLNWGPHSPLRTDHEISGGGRRKSPRRTRNRKSPRRRSPRRKK